MQDPYNHSVVVVLLGTDSKIMLENSQNWKLSELTLQVAKIENCQNCKLPKLKVISLFVFKSLYFLWIKLKIVKIESCQNWKLTKLKVAKIKSCQNWKLPKLKVTKVESDFCISC